MKRIDFRGDFAEFAVQEEAYRFWWNARPRGWGVSEWHFYTIIEHGADEMSGLYGPPAVG